MKRQSSLQCFFAASWAAPLAIVLFWFNLAATPASAFSGSSPPAGARNLATLFLPGHFPEIAAELEAAVASHALMQLDEQALASLLRERPSRLSLALPFEGSLVLHLERQEILSESFQAYTGSRGRKQAIPYQPGLFYQGYVEGAERSMAALSLFGSGVMAVIADEGGNINLGKLAVEGSGGQDVYVAYRERHFRSPPPFGCQALEHGLSTRGRSARPPQRSQEEPCPVEVYLEATHALFLNQGSSAAATADFLTGLYNVVAALYDGEGIKTQIAEIFVWSEADGYPADSTHAMLYAFSDSMAAGFNGDLAHLLHIGAPGGGRAWVDVLCLGNDYYRTAYSSIHSSYNSLPLYSWSVNVVAHELGHNFGARHTQACFWNGDDTQIDDCGNLWAVNNGQTPEGDACFDESAPIIPAMGGTVMSYCHLNSVGVNFALGFGPQPGEVLRTAYESCQATCEIVATCAHPDYEPLMALYHSTDGPNWADTTGWAAGAAGTNCDPCTWYGIRCDDNGRVDAIDFDGNPNWTAGTLVSGNNLNGSLPAELGQLSELKILIIGGNSGLSGPIPAELSALNKLEELSLYISGLSGEIPASLGNLSNLSVLRLADNNLSGEIPATLGNLGNLTYLSLRSNALSGPLPESLGSLSQLNVLMLYENQLSGPLPEALANLSGTLTYLRLQANHFSGCFPASYMGFCAMGPGVGFSPGYDFTGNPLLPWEGAFSLFCEGGDQIGASCDDGDPSTADTEILADCSCGEALPPACAHPDYEPLMALYHSTDGPNWVDTTGWAAGAAGTNCDPCTWYGVRCDADGRVDAIDLDGVVNWAVNILTPGNGLNGSLPPELGRLSELKLLVIGGNNALTGPIPAELADLRKLEYLALYVNSLDGEIPASLGSLDQLEVLHFHSNNLSGEIPAALGNLGRLTYLQLSANQLSGLLPESLGNLSNLKALFLWENQLSGPLPESLANLSSTLTHLFLAHNNFSGCYPSGYTGFCSLGFSPTPFVPSGYNFTDNPLLPWEGDLQQWCQGDQQISAPCNNGEPATIQPNCACWNCDLAIEFIAATPASCAGGSDGSISLSVAGVFGAPSFAWSDSSLDGQQNPIGLAAGTYRVTVTDGAGCEAVDSVAVAEPQALLIGCQATAEASQPGSTDGAASISIVGGTPPYSLAYDGPMNGTLSAPQGPAVLDGLAAGAYSLTVTDANGCEALCSFEIGLARPLVFITHDVIGLLGDTVCMPVTVEGFEQVLGFSMTVQLENPGVAEVVGLMGVGLPGSELSFNLLGTQTMTLAGVHLPGGRSLLDGDIAFCILLVMQDSRDDCTGLSLDGSLTELLASQLGNAGQLINLVPIAVDTGQACLLRAVDLAGQLRREDDRPVQEATVWADSARFDLTDTDGRYHFDALPVPQDYRLRPEKDVAPRNGVNIFDVVLLQQHILNDPLLSTPYRIIAADVNGDGVVNVLDASILIQLILFEIDSFPGVPSWRFVPADYVFPDPANPFAPPFPEVIDLLGLAETRLDEDFIGVKIGDLDLSASTDFGNGELELRSLPLQLRYPYLSLQKDRRVDLPIYARDFEGYCGWQLAVQFDTQRLELKGVLPGSLSPLEYNLAYAEEGWLSLAWADWGTPLEAGQLDPEEPLFYLSLRARARLESWEDELLVSGRMQAMAVESSGDIRPIELAPFKELLVYNKDGEIPVSLEAYPNPFKRHLTARAYFPKPAAGQMQLLDTHGRVLHGVPVEAEGRWEMPLDGLPSLKPGAYFLRFQPRGRPQGGQRPPPAKVIKH